jgi:hypothetical protein
MSSFSILLPVGRASRKFNHGDYFFGASLARALEKHDHTVNLFAVDEWDQAEPDDIIIVIRGRAPLTRRLGRMTLEWCISFFPKPGQLDYENIDHFFAASPQLQARIARIAGRDRVSLMYQAFDAELMYPNEQPAQNDMVFVGSPRSEDRRPVVSYAASSGLPFRLYGSGWEDTSFQKFQVSGNVQNEKLGDLYRSGSLVINDHLVIMRRMQIGSNRIYDGLACGRPVLNDVNGGLPSDISPYVYPYSDSETDCVETRSAYAVIPFLLSETRSPYKSASESPAHATRGLWNSISMILTTHLPIILWQLGLTPLARPG